MIKPIIISCAFFCVGAAAEAAPESEPICADRPGKANGTCTVPAGMVQIETSFFDWTRDRTAEVQTEEILIGETAFKLGISERAHVELGVAPFVQARSRGSAGRERISGFGDLILLSKYRFTADSSPLQLALSPFLKIPTAKRSIGNGKLEGGVALLIDYELPRTNLSLTLAPELDVNADSDGSGHHLGMVQVISLGIPLSARLGLAVDLWGQWDWDPEGTVRQFSIGPSAAYLLSNDVQIDAGVDFELNRHTPDVQFSSGIALRF